jgi:outer membrane protein assembly factor BamA
MFYGTGRDYIRILLCTLFWLSNLRAADPADDSERDYRIRWEGISRFELKNELKQSSRTKKLQDAPPPSLPLLRRRMHEDVPRLEALFKSNGYYLAEVKTKLDLSKKKPTVVFSCTPGPLFRFESITVHYTGNTPPRAPWTPVLTEKDAASTQNILLEESRLLRFLSSRGHPAPQLGKR